jgi:hypothetical protein
MRIRSVVTAAVVIAMMAAFAPAGNAAPKKSDPAPSSYCKKQKKGKKCPPTVQEGRMTGHGQQFNYQGFDKVQWEFRNSICNDTAFPDLKVEFGGNRFILTSYSTPLTCFTLVPPTSTEGQPPAGFDSIRAQGTGTLNGVAGAGITFRFTDAGEPGRNDTAVFTITAPDGSIAIEYVGGAIDGGNHQAHRK